MMVKSKRLLGLVLVVAAVGAYGLHLLAGPAGHEPDDAISRAVVAPPAGTGLVPVPPLPDTELSRENQRPGTLAWKGKELYPGRPPLPEEEQVKREKPKPVDKEKDPDAAASAATSPPPPVWKDTVIRGYVDQPSVNRGDAISFHVSTAEAWYDIEIYRLGWYGGAGARQIAAVRSLTGVNQPAPAPDPRTGLVEARWKPTYTLQTNVTWTSGLYLARFLTVENEAAYHPFVVRDDASKAPYVLQMPVTTWQAYNNWGGKSLYEFSSEGGVRAAKVSFDRPYAQWSGAGPVFDGLLNLVRWVEREGYDATYITSLDIHADPAVLLGHKVFVSGWHDEYWSASMRANITRARDGGVSLAWFGADNVYWQVRMEAGAGGVPNRVMVCYKDATDPLFAERSPLTTVRWREAPVNQPENALLGIMFESKWDFPYAYSYKVKQADHWLYAGAGVRDGDQIAGLVGYEYDRVFDNGQTPPGLAVLSESPVLAYDGKVGPAHSSVYQHVGGALVFSAGTIYWPWPLDANEWRDYGVDPRVQQMTANVLTMLATGNVPAEGAPVYRPQAGTAATTVALSTGLPRVYATGAVPETGGVAPGPVFSGGGAPGSAAPIYLDALAAGWADGSWRALVDFATELRAEPGQKVIRFAPTGSYGYLHLRAPAPFLPPAGAALRLRARADQPAAPYSVWLLGEDGKPLSPPRFLTAYGPPLDVASWQEYTVPLAELLPSAGAARVRGVILQEQSGSAGAPALYLSSLSLILDGTAR